MYYCEFPEDKNLILYFGVDRVVGKYLIVLQDELPMRMNYMAKAIVTVTDTGVMLWYKHPDNKYSILTKEEQQELMLQILKSETW